ncbi:glycerophosphodiester phosphodiesterase family protein [Actinomadura sp. WMMB 499]|uniref:glycerophosphodiester phosphodiesterase n=1 Tax=Actinomadura sp. WMMB 499 TaxID=1219491 RepID=UPI001243BB93|nr:glycerophosphodiester phosphodiesterase family protein [Actinomadura sp. WMMB 499]QFG23739.1 glycerophosphodiester phosphodiesterase [Actinomadura sp. WMMB 499]
MYGRKRLVIAAVVSAAVVTGPSAQAVVDPSPVLFGDPAVLLRAPGPVGVAHRGASGAAPENTLAAFRTAARMGADMFEIDVQETKDHKIVLLHDSTLARTTNVEEVFPGRKPWRVSDFTLAEVKRLDAGSWFGDRFSKEGVPTLAEVMREMRPTGLGMLVELKDPARYPGVEKRVAAVLRGDKYWTAPDSRERRLVVQSFDWASVRRFHKVMPDVPTALIGKPKASTLAGHARYADQINPNHRELTAAYVRKVHAADMDVLTWTVNDAAGMRRVLGLGVDGVITDRPDVFRKVVRSGAAAA